MFFRCTVLPFLKSHLLNYTLLFLLFTLSPRAQAQFFLPPLPTGTSVPSSQVQLENRSLFPVYGDNQQATVDRAELIQFRLNSTLRDLPNRPLPDVQVSNQEASPVVMVNGEPLVTVTDADIEGYGKDPVEIAQGWAEQVEAAFKRAIEERRPEFLRRAAYIAAGLVLAGLFIHLLLWMLFRRFLHRPGWSLVTFVWLGILFYILNLFPQSRPIYNMLTSGLLRPFMILTIVSLGAVAVVRLWTLLLSRIFPPLPETQSVEERTERTLLRRMTLIYVTRVTGNAVIWFVALLAGLTWSGVDLSSLLASAGLIGVALGLAAQDTMRDIVSGINVLLDDRYGVGDTIDVGEYSGKVERLNLRVTQIRDITGRLITLPNRTIERVANETASWSQVDFKVRVSYECDLRRAMEVVEETAKQLAEEWPDRILEPPKMLGVDNYAESNIELRMTVRTPPGDQWAVERELHLRVKEALDRAEFPPPVPRSVVFVDSPARNRESNGTSKGGPAEAAEAG